MRKSCMHAFGNISMHNHYIIMAIMSFLDFVETVLVNTNRK